MRRLCRSLALCHPRKCITKGDLRCEPRVALELHGRDRERDRWRTRVAATPPALTAIDTMECHMTRAARHAQQVEPRAFACCAHTQHATWLRVARLLSQLIVDAYGETCAERVAFRTPESRLASPPDSPRSWTIHRTRESTMPLYERGGRPSPGRGRACARSATETAPRYPRPTLATLAALAGLRDQGDVGLAGRSCARPPRSRRESGSHFRFV